MFVKSKIYECDFNNVKYPDGVEGAMGVARGATGRYCCVMTAGPDYLKENNITPLDYDKAVEQVESLGGDVDF